MRFVTLAFLVLGSVCSHFALAQAPSTGEVAVAFTVVDRAERGQVHLRVGDRLLVKLYVPSLGAGIWKIRFPSDPQEQRTFLASLTLDGRSWSEQIRSGGPSPVPTLGGAVRQVIPLRALRPGRLWVTFAKVDGQENILQTYRLFVEISE